MLFLFQSSERAALEMWRLDLNGPNQTLEVSSVAPVNVFAQETDV